MSLFGSLQLAGNTLRAMQIGLHVVGNNIANAKHGRLHPRDGRVCACAGAEDWQSDAGAGRRGGGDRPEYRQICREPAPRRRRRPGQRRGAGAGLPRPRGDSRRVERYRHQHVAHELLQQHRRSAQRARERVDPESGNQRRPETGHGDQHLGPSRPNGPPEFQRTGIQSGDGDQLACGGRLPS